MVRQAIKDEIPKKELDPKKQYVHTRRGNQIPARKVLEGIFYILRTSCQWKSLPREYGSGSTVHRAFHKISW